MLKQKGHDINEWTDKSAIRRERNLNLQMLFVILFVSLSLLAIGVVLNDARNQLREYAEIENELYFATGSERHQDNAMVLWMTADSYEDVISTLWGFGTVGLVTVAIFAVLGYRNRKRRQGV